MARDRWTPPLLAAIGIVVALVVGIALRLADPLSNPVIPAEDPYNHMALVREHLRDGSLDPLNEGSRLYPPGMHAFVAAAWVFTGIDLYQIVLIGPVLFGGVGILGVGLLLWRYNGPVASAAGALAYAVAPEVIFRTTMLAPTALDLAVLPFLFFSLIQLLFGRFGWAGAALPLCLFLVFSHPWVLTIVAFSGAAFALASLTYPRVGAIRFPLSLRGLAVAMAIVGVSWALALSGCGGACGPGFDDVFPAGSQLDTLAPILAFSAVGLALVLFLAAPKVDPLVNRPRRPGLGSRIAASLILAVFLAGVTTAAFLNGLPNSVNLVWMFGIPILFLAALAFVLLPLAPSPGAYLGASLVIVTYPFVVFNPFDSAFWPHRTAAYLGLGLALLAGVAAAAIPRVLRLLTVSATPMSGARKLTPRVAAAAPVVLVAALLITPVMAEANGTSMRWYRLFTECEHEALEGIAESVSADPSVVVITGAWQSKLVLAALATDASRIWYKGSFFTSQETRDADLGAGRPIFVVEDPYLWRETPGASTNFTTSSPWQEIGSWCPSGAKGSQTIRAYSSRAPAPSGGA